MESSKLMKNQAKSGGVCFLLISHTGTKGEVQDVGGDGENLMQDETRE